MLQAELITAGQWDAIDFICDGIDSLLAADVGTGKTVISLTAALFGIKEHQVKRWLVLAPLLVATDTWATEAQNWEHLQDLNIAIACGDEQQRLDALNSDAQIVVINYENLSWLLKQYPARPHQNTLPFDGLICDEIDKLKSVSSNRFKDFRNRVAYFEKRIGLTGTLLPNDLQEIWGQVFCVDAGQTFGKSFYKWRQKYFYPTDYKQFNWAPFGHTRSDILGAIAGFTYRLKAVDVPDVETLEPCEIELPQEIWPVYRKLEADYYVQLKDGSEIDAASSGVLSGKLQQIVAGFSYVDDDVVWHTRAKFDFLDRIYQDLKHNGHQLLVFYHFVEELNELKRMYPGLRYLGGGVSNKKARETIGLWNSAELDILALHPASAGHGLNLQKSGAHHIAFLTMPWSGGMFKQVVGRLARRGQTAKTIYIHAAVFKDTIDEHVFRTVTAKLKNMEEFLDALSDAA